MGRSFRGECTNVCVPVLAPRRRRALGTRRRGPLAIWPGYDEIHPLSCRVRWPSPRVVLASLQCCCGSTDRRMPDCTALHSRTAHVMRYVRYNAEASKREGGRDQSRRPENAEIRVGLGTKQSPRHRYPLPRCRCDGTNSPPPPRSHCLCCETRTRKQNQTNWTSRISTS